MRVEGRTAVVTGGGAGIGAALAARLAAEGARVLVADLDAAAAGRVSSRINETHPGAAVSAGGDVSDEACLRELLDRTEAAFGPVELYFANAGIAGRQGLAATDDVWDRALDVNLHAHVRAARLLLPGWLERGEGYFVSTASAAGLLSQVGSLVYTVTKHAAVAFAEWLSITYGDKGIRVSCLCPMAVNTEMLRAGLDPDNPLSTATSRSTTAAGVVLEPAQVADAVIAAMADERFLVLPHENVLDLYRQKTSDHDRWLRGMRRFQQRLSGP